MDTPTNAAQIRQRLIQSGDPEYRVFQSKLMPTVDFDSVIGVRTPLLRALAKELKGSEAAEEFMKTLPHQSYDENNLHAFLIEGLKDYDGCIAALNAFLPYVDNWATCDQMRPAVFKKHLPELAGQIKIWLASEHTYTVRFGIGMLMNFYLDGEFKTEYLDWVSALRSKEYYVNMMKAWYFATALAKHYGQTLPYISGRRLDEWTHNKTIRKACESYRITPEQKEYLKTLTIANKKNQ